MISKGYDPLLLSRINSYERDEIERLIMESFEHGDWEMGIFLPELQNYTGIKSLENSLLNVKIGSSAYLTLAPIAYNNTKKREYLNNTASLYTNSKNEDERLDIVVCLSKFEKSDYLYNIFKKCVS